MKLKMMGLTIALVIAASYGAFGQVDDRELEYDIGGPLFGVKLPLFPTQHGEPPGYPGCFVNADGNFINSPGGQFPQLQLYPGSVENFRYYWFHYMPVRSFFDAQSLVRNFPAPAIPGVAAGQVEQYAAPVYYVPPHGWSINAGRFNAPVPVVRARVNAPEFRLDFGELPPGLYAVRVIGAVETDKIERHRRPLYLTMTVNDGFNGETNTYKLRCGYVDEFYSMAEFYFHAPAARNYSAVIKVAEGSAVDLLVHNIDIHDTLAGTVRRPIKTKVTLNADQDPVAIGEPRLTAEERLARDAALWRSAPPVNATWGHLYGMGGDDGRSNWPNIGAGGLAPEQIHERYGQWMNASGDVLLVNRQLNLEYTMDDLRAGRPLPDPYPFKDDGSGIYTPPAEEGQPGQNWYPVANAVRDRWSQVLGELNGAYTRFRRGDYEAGRDAALLLARFAYEYPTIDQVNSISSIIVIPGAYTRDLRFRRRDNTSHRGLAIRPTEIYDSMFDFIKGNEELAASINRFIPWVETSDDVIELLDVYMVQTLAKRMIRYQYQVAYEPHQIVMPAMALGDAEVTAPWIEYLFTRSFTYPHSPAGLQDMLVIGYCRDGHSYIGSTYYTLPSLNSADIIEEYIEAGGDPRFSFMDREKYPKVYESMYFGIRMQTAGTYFPRMGSVTGPDKPQGFQFHRVLNMARRGWQETRDPDFAFTLAHFVGRDDETDEEWAEIQQAAAGRRAPWLENRSRVLPNFAAILESGTHHDDFRFRRSAILRIGTGYGHAHGDTLDLQLYAHGLPMTIDGGQRGGYSSPGDPSTRIHNLVEVNGRGWFTQAWIRSMIDADGARYMLAEAYPPLNHPEMKLYRRQVSLIDVDEGEGSAPLEPAQLRIGSQLPVNVVTPNSYLFDVVRVDGGSLHSYSFHANISDLVETNMLNRVPHDQAPEAEVEYLNSLRGDRSAGDAPAHLIATFPMSRQQRFAQEEMNLRPMWTPDDPMKFTRLHMLNDGPTRALIGAQHSNQYGYEIPNIYIQRRSEDQNLQSAYVAIIEPFVGEPFIEQIERLAVRDNENDALQAVAVSIRTRNGHNDILFADGRPEKQRQFGDYAASGEFVYLSTDAEGIRHATLAGGALLQAPGITIRTAERERTGVITDVDYRKKSFRIDRQWPALAGGERIFEVGMPENMTQFTAVEVAPDDGGSKITVLRGADYYLNRVISVDADESIVVTGIGLTHDPETPQPGLAVNWTATNEQFTRSWRADYLGGNRQNREFRFKLRGAPVSKEDFGEGGGIYLWEYGVGDMVRQATYVNLQRIGAGQYQLSADVDVEITLPDGRVRRVTVDELVRAGGSILIRIGG